MPGRYPLTTYPLTSCCPHSVRCSRRIMRRPYARCCVWCVAADASDWRTGLPTVSSESCSKSSALTFLRLRDLSHPPCGVPKPISPNCLVLNPQRSERHTGTSSSITVPRRIGYGSSAKLLRPYAKGLCGAGCCRTGGAGKGHHRASGPMQHCGACLAGSAQRIP